ncbi:hypothetical protein [Mucilaginibacter sp. KACC 22063]|uniref:hypothetical protein n=1 Tax=Mucilaginibacter sp. KACC 22063 TaxID=3025666 RepID=UPI002367174A|nr:hypothetical protein [Mucilaginibacter sp. KACC 22063]WDF54296.1 hypothetical protein PQ461_15225 [Mucilaginibacter sp. KACC 22063]
MLTIPRLKRDVYSPRDGYLMKSSFLKKIAAYPAPQTKLVKRNIQVIETRNDEGYSFDRYAKTDFLENITRKGGLSMIGSMGVCLTISSLLFNSHMYWPADGFLLSALVLFAVTVFFYKKS